MNQWTQFFYRDKAKEHLGKDVLLYTTDGDGAGYLKCGKVPGVYATVDFGSGADAASAFHQQRLYEPNGKSIFFQLLCFTRIYTLDCTLIWLLMLILIFEY